MRTASIFEPCQRFESDNKLSSREAHTCENTTCDRSRNHPGEVQYPYPSERFSSLVTE
jgi:hypothetical protein